MTTTNRTCWGCNPCHQDARGQLHRIGAAADIFQCASDLLGKRAKRQLSRVVTLQRRGNAAIVVQYEKNDVAVISPNGDIVVDTASKDRAGWRRNVNALLFHRLLSADSSYGFYSMRRSILLDCYAPEDAVVAALTGERLRWTQTRWVIAQRFVTFYADKRIPAGVAHWRQRRRRPEEEIR